MSALDWIDGPVGCDATYAGFRCTLPRGHRSHHIAEGAYEPLNLPQAPDMLGCYSWPRWVGDQG